LHLQQQLVHALPFVRRQLAVVFFDLVSLHVAKINILPGEKQGFQK
jgi:hypothetical protein